MKYLSLTLEHTLREPHDPWEFDGTDDFLDPDWKADEEPDVLAEESIALCKQTCHVWEFSWYPDTPVGFHWVAGPTLERVMQLAGHRSTPRFLTRLPSHTSLVIQHNQHKVYYEKVEKAASYARLFWQSEEDREQAVALDSIWTLTYKPLDVDAALCYDLESAQIFAAPTLSKLLNNPHWRKQ